MWGEEEVRNEYTVEERGRSERTGWRLERTWRDRTNGANTWGGDGSIERGEAGANARMGKEDEQNGRACSEEDGRNEHTRQGGAMTVGMNTQGGEEDAHGGRNKHIGEE